MLAMFWWVPGLVLTLASALLARRAPKPAPASPGAADMLVSAITVWPVLLACAAACAALLYLHSSERRRITRLGNHTHFSHAVIHGGTAYLAGVTAQADGKGLTADDSVEEQTRRTLAVIEQRLALAGTAAAAAAAAAASRSTAPSLAHNAHTPHTLVTAGTDKSRLLQVQIWLKDIARDFTPMNAAYGEWVDPANKPVRATVQSLLASPHMLVEIQVTAAMP